MKRLFPLDNAHTLISLLFSPRSVEEAVAEAQSAARDGAEAVAIELLMFPEVLRTKENFKTIIDSADLPFMFLDYRNDHFHLSDEKRMEYLFLAAEAGAGMIDVVGDLFAPAPDERAVDPAAIGKQKKVISELHAMGSQVIISSHPQHYMTTAEVRAQLEDFSARGADVVKLVARADTDQQYRESLATSMSLFRDFPTPFVYLCSGKFSRLQRLTSLPLGGAITFAVHAHYDFAPYDQPKIRDFVAVRNGLGLHLKDIQL